MKKDKFVIRVKTSNGHGCWVSSLKDDGDPSRTLIKGNALKFIGGRTAMLGMFELENKYPQRSFTIEKITE